MFFLMYGASAGASSVEMEAREKTSQPHRMPFTV